MSFPARVLLHHADGGRTPVDPDEVYLLEADGDETRVRMRVGDELARVYCAAVRSAAQATLRQRDQTDPSVYTKGGRRGTIA